MKRAHTLRVAILAGWALAAVGSPAAWGSQESPSPAAGSAPQAHGTPPAQEAPVVQGPVDSSLVIPEGPQFLGAPVLPGGTTVEEGPDRRVTEYGLPSAQVLAWYRESLRRYPDARYRDWEDEIYIEDQGGSKWHAIRISKTGGAKSVVTIQRDNWTWIFSTLLIRFIGVFVVLLVLWAALHLAEAILRRFVGEEGATPSSPTSA